MPYPKETVWSEDFAPDERDQILTQVRLGEITPEEAEELARSKRLRPFATRPDYANHDPFKKPYWTLTMALAWVATRDPQRVAHWDNDFRNRCLEWFPIRADAISPAGYELRSLAPADLRRFEEVEATTIDQHVTNISRETVRGAREALWSALLEDKITAQAIPAGERRRVPIPANEWQDMTTARANESGLERLIFKLTPGQDAHLDPRLPRDAILEIWPGVPLGTEDAAPRAKGPKKRASQETVEKFAICFKRKQGVPPSQKVDGPAYAKREGYQVKGFIKLMKDLPAELRLEKYQRQGFPASTSAKKSPADVR